SFGFQNVMIPHLGPGKSGGDDLGRAEVTKSGADLYKFRVSPLRNAALTPPYMHNGYLKNMWEVIEHYDHPMRSLMHSVWDTAIYPAYSQAILLDTNRERIMQRARSAATPNLLPRFVSFTEEEEKDLYCFLMVGLTDLSLQDQF